MDKVKRFYKETMELYESLNIVPINGEMIACAMTLYAIDTLSSKLDTVNETLKEIAGEIKSAHRSIPTGPR